MKKKKSSAARSLKTYEKACQDFVCLTDKTMSTPLDDIALRVIVSNIPKHRSTREETAEENMKSKPDARKPKLAA